MAVENEKTTSEQKEQAPVQNKAKTIVTAKQKKGKKITNAFLNTSPFKKVPSQLKEMQQVFNERYFNAPPSASGDKPNASGGGDKDAPKNNTQPHENDGGQNPLAQIAPFFNLLSGGKNPQIGNLMSALGSGNMDMNKMISAMVQNQATSASSKPSSSNNTPNNSPTKDSKNTTTASSEGSTIKNLNRI